jgi:hypothetical protein
MSYLYSFLGEKPFAHDFKNVKNVTRENDLAYGMPGLHDIRSTVEPCVSKWEQVLGSAGRLYGPEPLKGVHHANGTRMAERLAQSISPLG